MQVSVETLEGLERKITVQIPADKINQAVDAKIKSISKSVKVDGFRPGKVPLKVIKKMYGGSVKQEVLGDVIESTYQQALAQEKLRAAGMPAIEVAESEEKEDMAYTATFEVYPEIDKIEVKKIEVEKQTCEVADKDLDAMLIKLQEQNRTWKEVKRMAKKGDQVTCSFVGKIDGEAFQGGSGTDMSVIIGEGKMLKEFEAGLKGMKKGEEKTVDVTFPEDYQGKEVAGKTAQFDLTATNVEGPVLPKIDEEFAKNFGVEDGSVDTLKEEVKGNMEKELVQKLKSNIKNTVMAGLLEANEVQAPAALVKDEIAGLKKQAAQSMGQDPEKMDTTNFPDDLFAEEAERRVKLGVLVGEVIRKENIKVDEAKVDSTLLEIASSYDDPKQVTDYYNSNKQARANLEGMVLEDQVVDFILAQAKVTEKAVSFDSVMNK
ncbi:MAG: trigger factor [Gammaproteobacteria bacterium]|nr:trigger factor [Gammaproteobacteria bacterium]